MRKIIQPRKLVHSGKRRAYPSSFVWDCPDCESWNIWKTSRLIGEVDVMCKECKQTFTLDKSNPKEEITRTKNMKSIID